MQTSVPIIERQRPASVVWTKSTKNVPQSPESEDQIKTYRRPSVRSTHQQRSIIGRWKEMAFYRFSCPAQHYSAVYHKIEKHLIFAATLACRNADILNLLRGKS
jgi:hypothetical protein